MALKDRTKRLLADTLTEMLGEMPLEKVRVMDICRRADVQNQVFYYHFRDKYELGAWIFFSDFTSSFAGEVPEGLSAEETQVFMMTAQFERMWAKRDLYRALFTDATPYSLERYIDEFDVRLNTDALRAYLDTDTLTPGQTYIARATSHACLGLTVDWIMGRFVAAPAELARYQFDFIPDLLLHAYMETPAAAKRTKKGKGYRL